MIQYATYYIGGGISWLFKVSKVNSLFASTVIFLGQSEAPLMIAPYLRNLRRGQLFTVMSWGLAAVAGSTLVGYSLLGAPWSIRAPPRTGRMPASSTYAPPRTRSPRTSSTPSRAVPRPAGTAGGQPREPRQRCHRRRDRHPL